MPTDLNIAVDMAEAASSVDFNPYKEDKCLSTEKRRKVEEHLEFKRMKEELGIEELLFEH